MFFKLKASFGQGPSRPIFIIGTGRSGTNWIGNTLAAHPDIRATIEVQPMVTWSVALALNPSLKWKHLPRLLLAYRWYLFMFAPYHYLDKSHTNIWIAESLKKAFPNALFIGIDRNPFATVASMLKHEAVLAWCIHWKIFPVPNRFLGIDRELENHYEQLSLASRCAIRWSAHHKEMRRLQEILQESLLVLSYESLIKNTENELEKVQSFLGLKETIPFPPVQNESLDKWRTQLSDAEIKQISDIVGYSPDEYKFYNI